MIYLPERFIKALGVFTTLLCLIPLGLYLFDIEVSPYVHPFNINVIASWQISEQALVDQMFYSLHKELLQALLDWTAVVVAFLTLFLAFAHYWISKQVTALVIGVGLACAGWLDAFHTLAALRLIDSVSQNTYLLPLTWALARSFHAFVLLAGGVICLKIESGPLAYSFIRDRVISIKSMIPILLFFPVIAYFLMVYIGDSAELPQTVFFDHLIRRPYDLFPLSLFIFAIPVFWQLYKSSPNMLTASLVVSLIPSMFVQIYMAFGSINLYDNFFYAAYSLKILIYLIPFMGLLIDYIRIHHLKNKTENILQQYASALEKSNRELDEFAYVASHDLKAPLRVISNASKWLEQDLGEHLTGENLENMQLLQNRTERMEKLLDDLLEYSRIGRKLNAAYDEKISGSELIENISQLLALPEKFRLMISPDFSKIDVNRMPLQQILLNLISNAVKHHDKERGTIEVKVEEAADLFTFSVIDDGPGIPEQYHDQVFKMFQTLKSRDRVEGSGMGLAFVKKNIELFGGKIMVDSREGRGCTFRFTWPKKQRLQKQQILGVVLD